MLSFHAAPSLRPAVALSCALLLAACASDRPRSARPWRVELETDASWQTRNDVEIPNDGSGTRFALDDLTGSGPFAAGRLTADVDLDGRNGLRFVAAPLRASGAGRFDGPVSFAGEVYAPGVDTRARYRFDTYRLTWRRRMDDRERSAWHLGATLLVRDAEVALRQGATRSQDDDVGAVPLLHVAAEQALAPRWQLVGSLDAAVAPQGRAIDLALGARYQAGEAWDVTLGYRLLDGGADNDSVYTFAAFHSLVIAVGWAF